MLVVNLPESVFVTAAFSLFCGRAGRRLPDAIIVVWMRAIEADRKNGGLGY